MSAKGMAEGMTGQAFWPAEFFFMSSDVAGKKEGIDRSGGICLFGEEPSGRTSAGEPVLSEDIKSTFGEDRISV